MNNHTCSWMTYTGEKPCPCNMFDKPFKHFGDLTSHRRIHIMWGKPFQYYACGQKSSPITTDGKPMDSSGRETVFVRSMIPAQKNSNFEFNQGLSFMLHLKISSYVLKPFKSYSQFTLGRAGHMETSRIC